MSKLKGSTLDISACAEAEDGWGRRVDAIREFIKRTTLAMIASAAPTQDKTQEKYWMDRFFQEVVVPVNNMIRETFIEGISSTDPLIDYYAGILRHNARGVLSVCHSLFGACEKKTDAVTEFIEKINRGLPDEISPKDLDLENVDIGCVVENLLGETTVIKKPQNVTVQIEVPESINDITVLGHGRMLGEIFGELCMNAFHHMPKGGELRITVRVDGDEVIIEFCDNGKGIEAENIDHIFEKGFTTREQGTGQGLYLSKSYLERFMSGSIEVESRKGAGATFRVRMPRITETPA